MELCTVLSVVLHAHFNYSPSRCAANRMTAATCAENSRCDINGTNTAQGQRHKKNGLSDNGTRFKPLRIAGVFFHRHSYMSLSDLAFEAGCATGRAFRKGSATKQRSAPHPSRQHVKTFIRKVTARRVQVQTICQVASKTLHFVAGFKRRMDGRNIVQSQKVRRAVNDDAILWGGGASLYRYAT